MEWLVLVGDECIEHWVKMLMPDEKFVRLQLSLKEDVPILIGRP